MAIVLYRINKNPEKNVSDAFGVKCEEGIFNPEELYTKTQEQGWHLVPPGSDAAKAIEAKKEEENKDNDEDPNPFPKD